MTLAAAAETGAVMPAAAETGAAAVVAETAGAGESSSQPGHRRSRIR